MKDGLLVHLLHWEFTWTAGVCRHSNFCWGLKGPGRNAADSALETSPEKLNRVPFHCLKASSGQPAALNASGSSWEDYPRNHRWRAWTQKMKFMESWGQSSFRRMGWGVAVANAWKTESDRCLGCGYRRQVQRSHWKVALARLSLSSEEIGLAN